MADDDGAAPELAPPPPPPPPPLPSYPEMILETIDALDNDKGSNKTAISNYIKDNYGASLPAGHASLLTTNLGLMKSAGELVFARNNYFCPENDEEEVEEEPGAPATADPASPLHPDGHNDPVGPGPADLDAVEASAFLDPDDDGLFGPLSPLNADADGVPASALGVAADEIDVLAPDPVIAADDIDVPAPAPFVTDAPTAGPVKRGRGRPPKPKDPIAESSAAATDGAAMPAKRGRGRPPKLKDPAATDGEPSAAPFAAADANAPVKRGRGRPPKPKDPITEANARATSGMLSPRGRPSKKAKVDEATISEPAAAPDTTAPVKRGRGRPPQGEGLRPPAVGEPSES